MDLETDPGWQTGRQPFPLTVGEQVEVGADRADRPLMVEAWCTGHLHPRLPGWPTIPTMSPYGLPGFRGGPATGSVRLGPDGVRDDGHEVFGGDSGWAVAHLAVA